MEEEKGNSKGRRKDAGMEGITQSWYKAESSSHLPHSLTISQLKEKREKVVFSQENCRVSHFFAFSGNEPKSSKSTHQHTYSEIHKNMYEIHLNIYSQKYTELCKLFLGVDG